MNDGYIPSLTTARGLAAWWVVMYHFREALNLPSDSLLAFFLGKGFLAVEFFFVLSGFVIYRGYKSNFKNINFKTVIGFYVRRLARIYPLYLLIIIIYLVNPISIKLFSKAGDYSDRYNISYYVASVFMVQNWAIFDYLAWNIPGWSISTEFAAYLTFPFVCYFTSKFVSSYWRSALYIIVIVFLMDFFFLIVGVSSIGDRIPELGLVRCLLEFLLGVSLANFYDRFNFDIVGLLLASLFIAFAYFACYLFGAKDFLYVPIFFSFLICFLATNFTNGIAILRCGPLHFLGEISYSTYLIHFFIKDWVKFFSPIIGYLQFYTYIFFVLFASVVLYRYVEVPGKFYFLKLFSGKSR